MKSFFGVQAILFLMTVAFYGCGGGGMGFREMPHHQVLKVIETLPEDGGIVEPWSGVSLRFSGPVNMDSIDETSLVIARIDGGDFKKAADDVMRGDLTGISGSYEEAEDGSIVTFLPDEEFSSGTSYLIVATNRIVGPDRMPLSQHPSIAKSPFVSGFFVLEGISEMPPESVASLGGSGSGGGGGGAGGGAGGRSAKIRPQFLVINEILYDAVGSDTNGDVFVELVGDAGTDIGGYRLLFVNGDDGVIKHTINIPDSANIPEDGIFLIADSKTGQTGISNVEDADLILNFDPQNGPDCVQLLSDAGLLIDSLGYGSPLVSPAENGLECFEGEPAVDVLAGKSLSRQNAVDTGDNSVDFVALDEPSPGVL